MPKQNNQNLNAKSSRRLRRIFILYSLISLPFVGLGLWFGLPALLNWLHPPNLPKPEPSFLNMRYLLGIQKRHYDEQNHFIQEIAILQEEFEIKTQTTQYQYAIAPSPDPTVRIELTAIPLQDDLKSYSGAVVAIQNPQTQKMKTIAALCVSHKPQSNPPPMPILSSDSQLSCSEGKEFLY